MKETKEKITKIKLLFFALAVVVIIGACFLASALSEGIVPLTDYADYEATIAEEVTLSEPACILTEEEVKEWQSSIDFASLWAINEDVYAWISVPGTVIDYPILQHPYDDAYYLNYKIDGSFGYPGCIYTEEVNSVDFDDPNTIIYGHNMQNGTMFAGLHEFRDQDFFEKHREIIIIMPDRILNYRIFAAHVYDDRHLMYSFDFAQPEVFEAYLDSIFATRDLDANIDRDMKVTKDNHIITLVTCISGQDEQRLLVQAVLEN